MPCCHAAPVVPAGAWSSQLREWLPQLPDISGLKVHSIVVADPQQHTTADCLFLAYRYAQHAAPQRLRASAPLPLRG